MLAAERIELGASDALRFPERKSIVTVDCAIARVLEAAQTRARNGDVADPRITRLIALLEEHSALAAEIRNRHQERPLEAE